MKFTVFFLLFCFTVGCKTAQNTIEDTLLAESLSVDLIDLKAKGFLPKTQVFTSKNDPVYHKTKRFNAFPLKSFLQKYWNFDEIATDEMKIVFECEDGYKPEMPLSEFLSVTSYLAVSDADAPNGRDWEQVMKNGNEMIIEPFLLFYDEKVATNDKAFKRPYNLVKIHLQPTTSDELPRPADATVLSGYDLFNTNCKTCHAINGIGGTMGPELNYPKSVTEYWKSADLIAFIVNPSVYRNKVKMPTLGITTSQSQEIVKYLEYVSLQKDKP